MIIMSELKQLIEKYIELDDSFEEGNEELEQELDELGHEIDHMVYHEEFLIVFNKDGDEEKIVTMLIDESDEYFIPVYTDEEEVEKAIEYFKQEAGDIEFLTEKAIGNVLTDLFNLCLVERNNNENPKNFNITEENCRYYTSALKLQNMSKVLSDQRYVSFIN